jgi:hypothetical protein
MDEKVIIMLMNWLIQKFIYPFLSQSNIIYILFSMAKTIIKSNQNFEIHEMMKRSSLDPISQDLFHLIYYH